MLNKDPIPDEPTPEGEKKVNGVTIDAVPVVIVEIPSEGLVDTIGRKGSLRYRDLIEKEKVWETLEEKDEMSDSDADDNEKMNGDDREANCGEPTTDEESSTSTEEEVEIHPEHHINGRKDCNKEGPPTQTNLTTQLPYKIDEDDTNELLTSTA